MLGKNQKVTKVIGISSIIFCAIYAIYIIIMISTKEKITKETIVGINPITSTKSAIIYQEPMNVILESATKQQEKQSFPKQPAREEKIKEKQETVAKQEEIVKIQTVEESISVTIPTEYKGFATIGKIEIPKTGVDTPILQQVTVPGMENAPCLLYQTGELNQNGNNLIVGHNYRNGTLFSNNKNLDLGDKIYVTTLDGVKKEYTIYHKFVTTAEDVSYIKRDTNNKPEITLSCCTDDDVYRIVILAKIEG